MPQRDPDYPEAATEVAAARRRFKTGDRVKHIDYGWRGVVTGEPSDEGRCWTQFDGVGMFGADPRKLVLAIL